MCVVGEQKKARRKPNWMGKKNVQDLLLYSKFEQRSGRLARNGGSPGGNLPIEEWYVTFTLTERTTLYLQYIDWATGAEGGFHGYSSVRPFWFSRMPFAR